jgi:hypothetical protein
MPMRLSAVAIGLALIFGPVASGFAIPLSIAGASSGGDNESANTGTGFASATAVDGLGAAAEISIASGLLRVFANSGETTPDISPHATAMVQGWDRFTIKGLAPGTIVDLIVRLEISGSIQRTPLVPLYDFDSRADVIFDVRRADQAVVPTVPGFQAFVSASGPDSVGVDQVFTVAYRLAGPFSAFGLSFYALATANGISTSDFSHTAVLSFSGLPPGSSISSDTGFLQVPEPDLLALLLLSAVAIRTSRRRPQASRSPARGPRRPPSGSS